MRDWRKSKPRLLTASSPSSSPGLVAGSPSPRQHYAQHYTMAAAATMYPSAPSLGYAFNAAPAATHTLLNTSALPSWAPAAHNGGWMPATAHCSKFVSPQPFLAFDELSAAQLEHDLCQMELDFADPDLDLPGAADCLGIAGSSPRDIEPLPLPSAVQAGSAGAAGLGNADLSMTIRCHWCGGMKTRTGLCHSASCTQRRAADILRISIIADPTGSPWMPMTVRGCVPLCMYLDNEKCVYGILLRRISCSRVDRHGRAESISP